MSIKTMSLVWQNAIVGGSQLLVLLAMADFADDNGKNIYPSMATLAAKSRLSDSQVRRIVHELVALGLIELVETGGWDGRRNRSNEYRIVMERMAESMEGGTSMGASTVLAPARADPLYDPSLETPLETKRESNGATLPPAPSISSRSHPAIKAYYDLHGFYPRKAAMAMIIEQDPPIPAWVRAIRAWDFAGHNPTNFQGMLDWTNDPGRFEDHHAPKVAGQPERVQYSQWNTDFTGKAAQGGTP